jgi:hypothetical protein
MQRHLTIGVIVMAAAMALPVGYLAVRAESSDEPEVPQASPVEEPNPGRTIRGKLAPAERVLGAFLWERSMDLKIPLEVDRETGAFEAAGLRLGTYDLVVHTPWGRLEGVDMTPVLSEYDALIPPEYRTEDLGLPAEGEFTDEDRRWIEDHVFKVKRHENRIRILALRGTADVAVVLMELMLDRDFVGRKGDEITWRVEKWTYEKKYGGWRPFRTRALYRRRVSKRVWEAWGWQFEPALGGLTITEDRTEPVTVEFEIPEKPTPEKGLAGDRTPPPPGSAER